MNLEEVGRRIKYFRSNYLQISQEDFAISLGLDRTYMSRVESGKQNITLETFFKICDGLKIKPELFFSNLSIEEGE